MLIGAGSCIGAGALVTTGTVIPPGRLFLVCPGKRLLKKIDKEMENTWNSTGVLYRLPPRCSKDCSAGYKKCSDSIIVLCYNANYSIMWSGEYKDGKITL